MGRRLKTVTDEEVAVIERMAGFTRLDDIAAALGMSERTFYDLRTRDERVALALTRGRGAAISKMGHSLFEDAVNGDQGSRAFYLARFAGWKETTVNEHGGIGGGPIETKETGDGALKLAAFLDQLAERRGTAGEPSGS